MNCSNCGVENPDYAVYCLQCGNQIQAEAKTPQPEIPPPSPAYPHTTPPLPKGNGVLILIFGILGLIFCMPLGIVAWIMGNNDLNRMNAGFLSREEEGITQAGKVLGIIATLLFVLIMLVVLGALGFAFQFGNGSVPGWRF